MIHSFENDYSEGAHPLILKALVESNETQQRGYGSDDYCAMAREKIRAEIGKKEADVEFLVGGTQTNQVAIDVLLRPYEGVISANTGHIAVHEAGAIEATGHKVLELPQKEGKISADVLKTYLGNFYAEQISDHCVQPGMVYVTHPTEYGTLYSKEELSAIYKICKEYSLLLYVDGARLGYGVGAAGTDITMKDLAALCDVFCIGGTKTGTLVGEALVFCGVKKPRGFLTSIKRRGALLAKGRVLGVQFDALFTDGLFYKIGKEADEKALKIARALKEKGYTLYLESPTNQQFVKVSEAKCAEWEKHMRVNRFQILPDGDIVVRFVTDWSTTDKDVNDLIALF